MLRFLAYGHVKMKVSFPYTVWRLYYHNQHSFRQNLPIQFHPVRHYLSNHTQPRSFHVHSASLSVFPCNAQVVWKCLYNRHVNKIARAVSFALTRSNLVAPSVFALIFQELVCNGGMRVDAECIVGKEGGYRHTRDGVQVDLTVVFVSILEGLFLLLRAMYLAVLFFPCVVMTPFAESFSCEFRKMWILLVRNTLEKAGPAFIKWGQWAATRPDLFAQDLCAELTKLQAKAPAHSFAFTKTSIEQAFGRKLPEIFAQFEEEPVASGSVAQVHRATLQYRYPGQEIDPILVAVKVRHPNVAEAIRRDFAIMNFVARVLKFIPKLNWSTLDESVQQFAVFMMSQVDLAREAANLSRFIYNFRTRKDVSFPRPLYPLVHPSVLVETYEQGESILHYVDELDGNKDVKSSLAHIGTHALLKMLLVDNFIHADMHPGNILVRLIDDKLSHKELFGSRPQVVFLDVGMTAELSKKDRRNIVEFFKAVALLDGRTAAEYILKLSKQQNCPNPKAFVEEVDKCYNSWNSPDNVSIHPAECMQQLLEQVRRHKVNIDGNVCIVMVSTLVLQGWQRKLDPEYDVMQTLQSLLFKADLVDSLFYTMEGLMAP